MMKPFTAQELASLLAPHGAPCVSIFLPIHHRYPEAEQDPIRLRNVLGAVERLLRERYAPEDTRVLLEPVQELANVELWRYWENLLRKDYWRTPLGGIAAFRSPDFAAYYRIPMPLPELGVVADTFHIKPLLQFLQTTHRFFVLALSQKNVTLYEGAPYALGKAELPELPVTFVEALQNGQEEPFLNLHSPIGNGAAPIFHGHHGGRASERKKEALALFFRAIDHAVTRLLRAERLPLVLCGLDSYQSLYRRISRYPYLAEHGVESNGAQMSLAEIHTKVWPIVSNLFQSRETAVLSEYTRLITSGRVTDNLHAIAQAAVQGRVRQLLIAEETQLWGRLDRANGDIRLHTSQQDTRDDDILDDIAEEVLSRGGEILLLPAARLPGASPIAALLRW